MARSRSDNYVYLLLNTDNMTIQLPRIIADTAKRLNDFIERLLDPQHMTDAEHRQRHIADATDIADDIGLRIDSCRTLEDSYKLGDELNDFDILYGNLPIAKNMFYRLRVQLRRKQETIINKY